AMRLLAISVILFACADASAKPIALSSYDAGAFTVTMPKGWNVQSDASKGLVVAMQDPNRKDAAQALVVFSSAVNGTADTLLDSVANSAGADRKVVKRGDVAGGGKQLIVDGATPDGIKIRLGAIAVVGGGAGMLVMMVTKASDFDSLGGMDTVIAIITSIK